MSETANVCTMTVVLKVTSLQCFGVFISIDVSLLLSSAVCQCLSSTHSEGLHVAFRATS